MGLPISRSINIDIVNREGTLWVEIDGELDVATSPELEARLLEAEATDAPAIVIDLAGVSFIDSTGLRALLAANVRGQADSNRLRITQGGQQARRLFEVAGVLDRLPFIPAAEAQSP